MKPYEQRQLRQMMESFCQRVEVLTKKEVKIIFDGQQIESVTYNITPEQIIQICADLFGVQVKDIKCITRKHPIVFARHAACYYMKNFLKITLKEIGNELGGKDHATIINSIREWTDMMDSDDKYRMIDEEIVYEINKYKVIK